MIPRELIKKLRKIEIYTSRLANEQLAGSYHSVFKGRGMAFSEVRQYQPGDDVRFIDWNVSARMNEAYVKVFTEEREMTVMLLVDLSASERFGSVGRPKIEAVAEVAALLAFSAIKNNDRVGLILFTDRIERFVPPRKGRGHVMRVVTEILNAHPEGEGTDLGAPLELLGRGAERAEQQRRLLGVDRAPDEGAEALDGGLALAEELERDALVEAPALGEARVLVGGDLGEETARRAGIAGGEEDPAEAELRDGDERIAGVALQEGPVARVGRLEVPGFGGLARLAEGGLGFRVVGGHDGEGGLRGAAGASGGGEERRAGGEGEDQGAHDGLFEGGEGTPGVWTDHLHDATGARGPGGGQVFRDGRHAMPRGWTRRRGGRR